MKQIYLHVPQQVHPCCKSFLGGEKENNHSSESFSHSKHPHGYHKLLKMQNIGSAGAVRGQEGFPESNPKVTKLQESPPKKCWEIHKEEDPLQQGTFRGSLLTP